jgi:hypothetical protein
MSGSVGDAAFPKGVARPAQRALASIGVTSLEGAAGLSERQLRALRGMGPTAIEALRAGLRALGKDLKP